MGSPELKRKQKDITNKLVEILFEPTRWDYKKILSNPIKGLIIGLLTVLVILAIPPLVNCLVKSYSTHFPLQNIAENWVKWHTWLGFISLILELSLALLIGGSIFGNWIADRSQKKLKDALTKEDRDVTTALTNSKQSIETSLDRIRELRKSDASCSLTSLWEQYTLVKDVSNNLANILPQRYKSFLIAKMTVAFPGGLYGLVAFFIFWLALAARVLTFYVAALKPVTY